MSVKPTYDETLIGTRFGSLVPVRWHDDRSKFNRRMVICRCDCGREIVLRPIDLLRKNISKCSYCKERYLIGQTFGRLTVIDRAGFDKQGKRFKWLCKCECGNTTKVETSRLTSHRTDDCGCQRNSIESRINKSKARQLPGNQGLRNKVVGIYKRNAKLRNLSFELTYAETEKLLSGDCFYCGCQPSNLVESKGLQKTTFVYNGIDRLDNKLGYTPENSVSCCSLCNYKKGDQHVDDFLKWIASVANHRLSGEVSQRGE